MTGEDVAFTLDVVVIFISLVAIVILVIVLARGGWRR